MLPLLLKEESVVESSLVALNRRIRQILVGRLNLNLSKRLWSTTKRGLVDP